MRVNLLGVVWLTCLVCAGTANAAGRDADESAIRAVIEQRRLAWNAEDVEAYARLLAEDADILSATDRTASGRDEVIRLYVEQRSGAYRGASISSTVVTRIKFVRPDVAVADADTELTGVRGVDGNVLAPSKSQVVYVLAKDGGQWLISCIRGLRRVSVQAPRQ
jgi:uncharacterized protein (TIGR02246 family)